MKTLYLMRHAKSDWGDPSLADIERPLNDRGRGAAKTMAKYLEREGIEPSVVLCTSAVRARETLDALRPSLTDRTTVKIEPELYGATSAQLLTRLRELSSSEGSVLVVGHNPGMQDLVLELASEGSKLDEVRAKFPTAALAVLEAPLDDWGELAPGGASLVAFVTPRSLQV